MSESASSDFIISDILPANNLHLIFGPISDDVTSLALLLLKEWQTGAESFGRPTTSLPFCYVTTERTAASLRPEFSILGLDPCTFPHLSILTASGDDLQFSSILSRAKHRVPDLRLLVIDGIARLCPGRINDYKDVCKFLTGLSEICHHESLTVIGCTTGSKSKNGEGYAAARDRVHGSIAWTNTPHTKILIESIHRDSRNSDRTVTVMPRSRNAEEHYYSRIDGSLTPRIIATIDYELDKWLADLELDPPDRSISTGEIIDAAKSLEISRSSAERWIVGQLDLGCLVRVGARGSFRRVNAVQ